MCAALLLIQMLTVQRQTLLLLLNALLLALLRETLALRLLLRALLLPFLFLLLVCLLLLLNLLFSLLLLLLLNLLLLDLLLLILLVLLVLLLLLFPFLFFLLFLFLFFGPLWLLPGVGGYVQSHQRQRADYKRHHHQIQDFIFHYIPFYDPVALTRDLSSREALDSELQPIIQPIV